MYKVIVNLHDMNRYGHVLLGEDELIDIVDKVQEKYGSRAFNIVSVHNADPEEVEEYEPISRGITMFAVGTSFKDAIARGHVRRHKASAEETLMVLMQEHPDKAWGIYGFDVHVDENSNHWNA